MSVWSFFSTVLKLRTHKSEEDRESFFLFTRPEHIKALNERRGDKAMLPFPVKGGGGGEGSASSSSSSNGELTLDWVKELIEHFAQRRLLNVRCAKRMLKAMIEQLDKLPNVVDVEIPPAGLVICGDIHGQFYDFLTIFRKNGFPSSELGYIFNGDFVDRGSMGVEVFLTLCAFKLLYPKTFHLCRGNHECTDLTLVYGFAREVSEKYDEYEVYRLFTEAFRRLPVSMCVQQTIIVMHGGLCSDPDVTLKKIRAIERREDPVEDRVLQELLWSDPQDKKGVSESPRGAGVLFGADVTKHFCANNHLAMIIRSHELKFKGFSSDHGGKCVTIFSAPNYRGFMGNKGAWMMLHQNGEHRIVQFSGVSKKLVQHFDV